MMSKSDCHRTEPHSNVRRKNDGGKNFRFLPAFKNYAQQRNIIVALRELQDTTM